MARGIFAGMTDYSHQSFEEVLLDIDNTKLNAISYSEAINKNISVLEEKGGLWKKQPYDMKNIIAYCLTQYATIISECSDILSEIKRRRVEEHHCRRLSRIAEVCRNINVDIGQYWHNDYDDYKDYEDENFQFVENIYCDARDAAVYFLDLENISERLKDFIGKTSEMEENQQKATTSFHGAQFGHNTVIVVGNNNNVNPNQVMKNDISSLENVLRNNNVSQEDINELKAIVQTETPDTENKRLGEKANGWIAKMVNKCLDGSWAIGIGAAGKLLADAIKHYYGLFQ